MKKQRRAFVIVRVDDFVGKDAPLSQKVTVKEVLWSEGAAEAEVERFNRVNGERGCIYFWQATRVLPEDEGPSEEIVETVSEGPKE